MQGIEGATDSREISNEIKDSAKTAGISEYGDEKLPCGDLSGREIVVVEGEGNELESPKEGGITSEEADSPEVQVRKNFNETAFFYPDLYTDYMYYFRDVKPTVHPRKKYCYLQF